MAKSIVHKSKKNLKYQSKLINKVDNKTKT